MEVTRALQTATLVEAGHPPVRGSKAGKVLFMSQPVICMLSTWLLLQAQLCLTLSYLNPDVTKKEPRKGHWLSVTETEWRDHG
ncbi:hypothetical protein H920_04268 [Fukomys damarensis]|uniref:Uncharacterized protein n=1 Tax=Fukomys damarensis TaxID=885580 RepID=A0A091DVM5_FUKDA|nr:hypothetical protein H920_04268 [Fukomys damarensis]